MLYVFHGFSLYRKQGNSPKRKWLLNWVLKNDDDNNYLLSTYCAKEIVKWKTVEKFLADSTNAKVDEGALDREMPVVKYD